MLKQLFTFAFRSFRKSALINSLNVTGLTLGLSVFFLVSLFVYQERSYEHDFAKRDRIYQLGTDYFDLGKMARASDNLAFALSEIPEIEHHTSFTFYDKNKVFLEGNDYQERKVIKTDASFFDLFEFELLAGDIKKVFDKPGQVIINEETALEIFGTTDVLGKELKVGTYLFNYDLAIIQGVSRSPKYKTQLDFDILVSKEKTTDIKAEDWGTVGPYVYATLREGISPEQLEAKLTTLTKQKLYPIFSKESGATYEEWLDGEKYLGYFATSLDELRYESETAYSLMPKADLNRTNTLIIVGLAALLISMINFINMATAQASLRMKEVALKRVMGSSRKWLVVQFMLESFMMIALSSILALGLVEAFITWQPVTFSGFVEYSVMHSGQWVYGVLAFVLGLTLFSGLYPALYLSSGNVVTILKSGLSKNSFSIFNAALLRKGATVLQFICSIGLIGGVITMFMQIDHLKHKDLGFESGDVLVIRNIHDLGDKVDAFRKALQTIPAIESAGYANDLPVEGNDWNKPYEVKDASGKTYLITHMGVEGSFFQTLDLDFVSGKSFSVNEQPLLQNGGEGAKNGSLRSIVLNEQAVKVLGLKDPVGQTFNDQLITGVVENFLFRDLTTAIEPMILYQMKSQEISPFYYNPLFIEMNQPSTENRAVVEGLWEGLTDKRIDIMPMDTTYEALIAVEKSSFNAVLIFSIFAVLVSCIGLFGLAVFTVDQRIKEFGVRKVLGATVQDIIRLFSWDFLKLVLLAFIIAMPIAMYVLDLWLNGFADRIDLGYSIVLFTGALAAMIAVATVLFQSIKAGRLNPVDTLRSE